jgi:hypothetical protein
LNGIDIPGATSPTLTIEPPYGIYTCYCTNEAGCISSTDPYQPYAGFDIYSNEHVSISPNPSTGDFEITAFNIINNIHIFSSDGKLLQILQPNTSYCKITGLKPGIYFIEITLGKEKIVSKFIQL